MNVKELIEQLEEMPEDFEVFFWVDNKRVNVVEVRDVGDCVDLYERKQMKRYKGTAVFKYYQVIEVEAESQDEAEDMMFDLIDVNKAELDDCELEEVTERTL